MIELISHWAAEDVMLECSEGWSKSDRFITALVKITVSKPSFIRPVVGVLKQHVDLTIDTNVA